mmetsp:Transcript_90201/g.250643  ORF Transcript_90201/g.250643 Transcript_90201/m.250643 type:complete len:252 (+) Transcript_90201:106-861(+)
MTHNPNFCCPHMCASSNGPISGAVGPTASFASSGAAGRLGLGGTGAGARGLGGTGLGGGSATFGFKASARAATAEAALTLRAGTTRGALSPLSWTPLPPTLHFRGLASLLREASLPVTVPQLGTAETLLVVASHSLGPSIARSSCTVAPAAIKVPLQLPASPWSHSPPPASLVLTAPAALLLTPQEPFQLSLPLPSQVPSIQFLPPLLEPSSVPQLSLATQESQLPPSQLPLPVPPLQPSSQESSPIPALA